MSAGLGSDFAPAEALAALPALYSTDGQGDLLDKPLLVKWFCPYSNVGPWYAAEHTDGICFGWVAGPEPEWGNFDLAEMEAVRLMAGMLPAIERDVHWEPSTLRQIQAEAGRRG